MKATKHTVSRRDFLCTTALGGAAWATALVAQPLRKPNFVVILADDLGYGDLSCYRREASPTPNLDRMAARGLRFTDFHSNGPVCSPTRTALLTGCYQQRFGIEGVLRPVDHRDKPGLPPESTTFAERLRDAGYATSICGKWHLGYRPEDNPLRHGFDEFHGFLSGNVDYHSHIDGSGRHDWWNGLEREKEPGYTTDLITEYGIRFLQAHAARPFCLYLPYNAVHAPYQGPNDPAGRSEGMIQPGEGGVEDRARAYREMLGAMDAGVGKIMDTLASLGLERDTLVFFCSDNGAKPPGSNGTLAGMKGTLLEGGHRVPGIACWPGRIAAGTTEQTAMSMDVLPTILEAAGLAMPEPGAIDGVSLFGLITKGTALPERTLFWRTHGKVPEKAVRRGPWKLRVTRKGATLHQLADDPSEREDCAGTHADQAQTLTQALAQWEERFRGVVSRA